MRREIKNFSGVSCDGETCQVWTKMSRAGSNHLRSAEEVSLTSQSAGMVSCQSIKLSIFQNFTQPISSSIIMKQYGEENFLSGSTLHHLECSFSLKLETLVLIIMNSVI